MPPIAERSYESTPATRVAFLGLGVMGHPMAGHLARAGHHVTVYNRTLANYAGVGADGRYIYSLPTDADGNYDPQHKVVYDAGRNTKTNVVSRWSIMLTLRYSF